MKKFSLIADDLTDGEEVMEWVISLVEGKEKTKWRNCRLACYVLGVLWGQPIQLIQLVSTSEFHEY